MLPGTASLGLAGATEMCAACARQPPPVDLGLARVDYGYPWSELIGHFKFAGQAGWGPFFARLMLQSPAVQQAVAALRAGDFILPMPLSARRLQERGFNQAWELARSLAQQSGSAARAEPRLLLRTRDTQAQAELKLEARLANVQNAFVLEPQRASELTGRRAVLVDDVMTSGASLYTAARALRQAGALHISVLAFARTPAP